MLKVDKELIDLCKKGDRRAQNKLYELCYGILLSICLRYEKNIEDAKHMLNIGFLKIAINLDKYSPEVNFEHWIRRIMINTNIDEFRRNKKRKELFSDVESDISLNNSSHYHHNQSSSALEAEDLEMMIRSLPADMQKVFNLFAIDGYSHNDISDMMGIPVGTSKWLVSTARQKLRVLVERHNNIPKAIKI